MHRRTFVALASLALASAAYASSSCSEATDGVVPDTTDAASQESAAADGPAPEADGAATPDAKVPVTLSSVVINEISPADEWVELVASGTTAIDVSGYRVADSEKDGGTPKLSDAVKFPPGTILSPKAYVIVQGGGLDGGGRACPDGGQSYCFNAEFGVSNKTGETLFFLDATGAVVGTAVYPPKAAAAGESWGRIPNGDPKGTFVPTVPTPGAANQAK